MLDLKKNKYLKYLLFSIIYFNQGILFSITLTILPIYLLDVGYSISLSSFLVGIIMLPWSIKFIWGGIVDYFRKYGRKKFIIAGGFTSSSSLLLILFVNPNEHIFLFTMLFFISVLGIVILDIAGDAWAIEASKKNEYGKVNGLMIAGVSVGRAFGLIFFGYAAITFGYYYVFLFAGLIILFVTIFLMIFKETRKKVKTKEKIRTILIEEFKKNNIQKMTLIAFFVQLGGGILTILIPLYFKDIFNFNISQIGLFMTYLLIISTIGSIISGILADKYGRKKIIYLFTSLSILFIISLALINNLLIVIIIYGIFVFFSAGNLTSISAMIMDIIDHRIAATQFSIFLSVENSGFIFGNSISGSLIALIGYNRTILYSAWFLGPLLIILFSINSVKKIK